MDLYLLRHGIAEDGKSGMDDPSRALTPSGRSKLKHVLLQVAQAKVVPALILSSPLKRALQTAELAARELGYNREIVRTKALEPGGTPEGVWSEIRTLRNEPSIMLVGHNPLLSHLASFLLGAPSLEVDFKKGGLMKVGVESFSTRPHGVLRWYLTAKLAASKD